MAIGCDRLFTDTMSGAQATRPDLEEAFAFLRSGDTLVVWRLDRLGRSLKALIELMTQLQARKIGFVSLSEQINPGFPRYARSEIGVPVRNLNCLPRTRAISAGAHYNTPINIVFGS